MARWIAAVAVLAAACGGGGENWVGADPVKADDKAEESGPSDDDPRPRNKRDLITRALKAITRNDPDAYIAMLPTNEEIESSCPADYQLWYNMRPNLERNIRAKIAECNELIDWGHADSVGGKDLQRRDSGCEGQMYKHSDVKLLFRVDDKRYRVIIDDPGEFDGIFVVSDAPQCELDE